MEKKGQSSSTKETNDHSLQEQLAELQTRLLELQVEKNEAQSLYNQLVKQIRGTKTKWAKLRKTLNATPPSTPMPVAASVSFDLEMIFVEGGTFKMGSRDYANERPIHLVTLDDFWVSKYPITQAQWQAVMGQNPAHFVGDALPVETISWNDAQLFIKRLNLLTNKNYRLPTEAEWEFAAKGGNQTKDYKYSGSDILDDVAFFSRNSQSLTHPVGQKLPNELGIHDMSGNIWEWCSDIYGLYTDAAVKNPMGAAEGTSHVHRGGSWYNTAMNSRSTRRHHRKAAYRANHIGFRLVCSFA
jgi:formylglycine-generating enzyme required for sulfatase activity